MIIEIAQIIKTKQIKLIDSLLFAHLMGTVRQGNYSTITFAYFVNYLSVPFLVFLKNNMSFTLFWFTE